MADITIKCHVLVTGCIIFMQVASVVCINCYSCTYTDNISKVGYECVTNPANYSEGPNKVECEEEGICHMEKTISKFNNQIDILVRGCGHRADGCEEDNYEQRCTRTCSGSSLCNDWNEDPATTTTSTTMSTTHDPNHFVHCYSCQHPDLEGNSNEDCMGNPEIQPTVRCDVGSLCYVFQLRDKGTNKILTFERNCGTEHVGSDCSTDTFYEYCHDTCFEDYCNDEKASASVLRNGIQLQFLSLFATLWILFRTFA